MRRARDRWPPGRPWRPAVAGVRAPVGSRLLPTGERDRRSVPEVAVGTSSDSRAMRRSWSGGGQPSGAAGPPRHVSGRYVVDVAPPPSAGGRRPHVRRPWRTWTPGARVGQAPAERLGISSRVTVVARSSTVDRRGRRLLQQGLVESEDADALRPRIRRMSSSGRPPNTWRRISRWTGAALPRCG